MVTKHQAEGSLQAFAEIFSTLAHENKAPEASAVARQRRARAKVATENGDATFARATVYPSFWSGQKKISRYARVERRDLVQSVQYERFLESSRAFWTQYRH